MTITFRPGRIPNDPSKPRLRAAAFLSGTAPASADHYSGVPAWGMLGNDQWGDCVFACDGHIVDQQTALGDGTEATVSTAQALAAYSIATGFRPGAGPPGQNPTDNGAQVQDGLSLLRKRGMNDHKIAAFAELQVSDLNKVKVAVAQLGAVAIGISLPASAMSQFNSGQPWTVVAGSPIDGGHCVVVVGYDASWIYVVTWGQVQRMSYGFWGRYVDEAWAVVSQDWAGSGKTPDGVDLFSLGEEFSSLTGQASPFPAPQPPPPPAPVPPVPAPPSGWAAFLAWLASVLKALGL